MSIGVDLDDEVDEVMSVLDSSELSSPDVRVDRTREFYEACIDAIKTRIEALPK